MRKSIAVFGFLALVCGPAFAQVSSVPGPNPLQPTAVGTAAVGQIPGTATNDSAAASKVGEYVTSGAVTTASTGDSQYFDVTSISLTAGDWDVSAIGECDNNGGIWSRCSLGVGTATGNVNTGLVVGDTFAYTIFAASAVTQTDLPITIPAVRKSLSGTTTIYLKSYLAFSTGAPSVTGRISARRIR